MLLVPEVEFRRLQKCDENVSTDILDEVKRPNELALVKKYTHMERMMHDPVIPDQEKVARHVESMNDFLVLKKKLGESSQNEPEMTKPSNVNKSENDAIVTEAIELLPLAQRERGRQLFQRLQRRKDLISWNDKGEVTMEGRLLPGSNISDLVSDVMRTRKQVAPLRSSFLDVLARANVPDEFVRNKTALAQFRKVKSGDVSQRPPGLPELQERDLDSIGRMYTQKRRGAKVKQLGKAIKWKNL